MVWRDTRINLLDISWVDKVMILRTRITDMIIMGYILHILKEIYYKVDIL